LSGTCIWEHSSQTNKGIPYVKAHTPVLFGWKRGGRHRWYADRTQTTIFNIPPVEKPDYPVALMGYAMLNSSLSNGIILAPFGGYGAALLAAEQSGRVCMMAESDEQKCRVIIKRYINMTSDYSVVAVKRDGALMPYAEVIGNAD
jgi:DNA modification methylase